MPLNIGDIAPDFTLRDQNNEEITLSSFRGSKVVLLVFYPWAFTGVCTNELGVVRDNIGDFSNDEVEILTVSVDSSYAHKIFAEREDFEFHLLGDFWPHGVVAQAYGVFNDQVGVSNRGTFLVDKQGVIRFAEMNSLGEGRDANVWREQIQKVLAEG
jgi:peroxiredoxin (alkyl hydroperoxide reductase subunit C)